MRRLSFALLAACTAFGATRTTAHAEVTTAQDAPAQDAPTAEPAPLSVRVNLAIAHGVKNLLGHQQQDGRWLGDETRYPGGLTAFVAYTLLKSGVRRSDPGVNAALRALSGIPHRSTYGTGARLLLYQALGDPAAWREQAQACADALVSFQREGLWGYPEDPIDLSNVQFALLGLRAASDMGIEVPERTLEDAAQALWRMHDEPTGGFRYHLDTPATAGITAATLGDVALLEEFARSRRGIGTPLSKHKKETARAEAFLIERFDPARNAWGPRAWTPSFHHCHLWAIQRYCELKGLEDLGGRDWYREGAEYLVATQKADGGWGEQIHDTCFALLFLRRTTFSGGRELEELYSGAADAAREARTEPVRLDADAAWITAWLAAGPFTGKKGESGLLDPPFDPERVRARAGARVAREELLPLELKSTDWSNLEDLTGRHADVALWVLATQLTVPEDAAPVDALLWLALEDGWRVLLDGVELSHGDRVQAPIRFDTQVPLTLAPGAHELVIVVEDAKGAAAFGARISAPDGKPLAADVTLGIELKKKR